ncbi:hypothetical protein RchiOBHm_Chr5g0034151 [Rosa chinensis]|uniref:Uncharacterized protein n=1 Tax=Rosa chinensis TaxID=74649 RepID=A0A2P6QAV5_ROSCH|nr:hypothetical protein RchiOBHm_Chr5g0034151 [Rosa chinensis]
MATKTILKDAKAPLLLFRSPYLAAAIPNTAPPNPLLIQTIQPSHQKPLLHLSGLRQYLYQQPPSPKVDGLGLSRALDSTLRRLQARGSDDEEEDDSSAKWSDDENCSDFDSEDVCDEEKTDSED